MNELIVYIVINLIIGIACILAAKICKSSVFNILAACVFVFVGMLLMILNTYNTPKAIDVYKGKTTLKITYKDSIPVDTVVVFKNK